MINIQYKDIYYFFLQKACLIEMALKRSLSKDSCWEICTA